jgi:hypothetical protein
MNGKPHVLVVFACVLSASAAHANPRDLERALSLYESGELAGSLAVFERALAGGENDPGAMRTIYVHLGILRAGAGDSEGAVQAFRALLSLDPAAQPPPDASPVILEPFAVAKSGRSDAPPLGVVVGDEPEHVEVGQRHVVRLRLLGDTEHLVDSVVVRILRGPATGASIEPTGTDELSFDFPAEASAESGEVSYRIDLLDAHGSTLLTVGPRSLSVFAKREPTRHPTILSSPIFWGGTAAAIAGAILVGILASGGSGKATVGAPEWSTR